jgi:hypothetical protein
MKRLGFGVLVLLGAAGAASAFAPVPSTGTAAPLRASALLTVQWKANASCADLVAAFDVRLEKLRAANDKAKAAGGADQVLANKIYDLNEEMAKIEDQQIADGCPTSR